MNFFELVIYVVYDQKMVLNSLLCALSKTNITNSSCAKSYYVYCLFASIKSNAPLFHLALSSYSAQSNLFNKFCFYLWYFEIEIINCYLWIKQFRDKSSQKPQQSDLGQNLAYLSDPYLEYCLSVEFLRTCFEWGL